MLPSRFCPVQSPKRSDEMPLCTDLSVVNGNRQEGEISMLRCKRWQCEVCHPVNRQKVIGIARRGEPNTFMTLTCDPQHYDTPDEAARDMKRGLVLLRRAIERKWNVKNIPFLVVFERHKSGWPHMHLLMRASYMHWETLRGIWNDIVGAYQVDIRRIKKRSQIYYYVTKYVGKELAAFEGCKRWWRSQNYNVVAEDLWQPIIYGSGFVRIAMNFERVQQILEAQRFEWEIAGRHKVRYRATDETFRDGFGQVMHWEYAR